MERKITPDFCRKVILLQSLKDTFLFLNHLNVCVPTPYPTLHWEVNELNIRWVVRGRTSPPPPWPFMTFHDHDLPQLPRHSHEEDRWGLKHPPLPPAWCREGHGQDAAGNLSVQPSCVPASSAPSSLGAALTSVH